jgi:hypothetical protein
MQTEQEINDALDAARYRWLKAIIVLDRELLEYAGWAETHFEYDFSVPGQARLSGVLQGDTTPPGLDELIDMRIEDDR